MTSAAASPVAEACMANIDMIREIKKYLEEGKPLDIDMRDRLLLSAVIDIYESQEKIMNEIRTDRKTFTERLAPLVVFYQVGLFFASAIGIAVLSVVGALLTGQVEMSFK
jgi:hypothetical protein